jgi:hypothetical protein
MRSKLDWGLAFGGALLVTLGGSFVWSGRSGLLYHSPIYFKGPTWVDPWQAIIGGALFTALGLTLIALSLRKKRRVPQNNS